MKRIYFDLCCYNRPFDNQSEIKIRLEADAKLCNQRAPFDYTEWRQHLFDDVPLDEFLKNARRFDKHEKREKPCTSAK